MSKTDIPKTLPIKLWPFIWHFLKPYKLAAFSFVLIAVLAGFWGSEL
jgi:ATP-binding cassette, subfamily B, bacterial